MKFRIWMALGTVLVGGGTAFVMPSSASAAEPHCNSYRNAFFSGTPYMYRQPSVGRDGSVECQLRQGDKGDGVKVLQYTLACNDRANYPDGTLRVKRDGDFGPITKSALAGLQRDLHITADGQYGPQTRNAIVNMPVFRDDPSGWWFVDCY